MKRPPEAPIFVTGRLTQVDFDAIHKEVTESLAAAYGRQAAAAAAAEVRGGGAVACSPATNRGGKSGNCCEGTEIAARLVLEDGTVKEIPARRGYGGDTAFLDWVNFTTDEVDFFKGFQTPLADIDVVRLVSAKCHEIFGFGITSERETGANFYHRSYILGDACGMVCHGGQRATVLVMLSAGRRAAARQAACLVRGLLASAGVRGAASAWLHSRRRHWLLYAGRVAAIFRHGYVRLHGGEHWRRSWLAACVARRAGAARGQRHRRFDFCA